jgi:hypothetical protein
VAGADNVSLDGRFASVAFDGPYGRASTWVSEAREFARVLDGHTEKPAAILGRLIHKAGLLFKHAVDGFDLAGHRREDFARGLHALHDSSLIAARKSCARCGQFDEDDIAQRLLCIVGDAHRADSAIDADIFMVFGVEGLRHDLSHPR